jgi:capsular polysaccharide biosynthesis protein
MNLIDYARILLRRGWIMVLCALIAAGSAYFLTSRQTTQYRAVQFVLIQPSRSDLGQAEALLRLMNSYRVYLYSSERAQEVIDELRLDMLAGDLMGDTQIITNQNDYTVEIDTTLPDAQMAADVARTWGNLLVLYRQQDNQTLQQQDRVRATLPDKASVALYSPRPAIAAVAGGILGFLVGGVIVFVLEYLESSIVRRREDIERALDLPVLASIPDMER